MIFNYQEVLKKNKNGVGHILKSYCSTSFIWTQSVPQTEKEQSLKKGTEAREAF